jgi:hypothetical protein
MMGSTSFGGSRNAMAIVDLGASAATWRSVAAFAPVDEIPADVVIMRP